MLERDTTGADGQSEVIGVLLLVAITIVLSVVVAVFVFDLGERTTNTAPQASFTVELDEGAPDSQSDSFGTQGTNYDGLLRITHSDGETIPAEQLWIRGVASQSQARSWADTDNTSDGPSYEPGSRISSGDSLTVWVNLDDTVRVTWTSQTGETSATLRLWRGPES